MSEIITRHCLHRSLTFFPVIETLAPQIIMATVMVLSLSSPAPSIQPRTQYEFLTVFDLHSEGL